MSDLLNPQQRAAVEYSGDNVLVLAGAGTGKTRTIIERTDYLIRKGVEPQRILILTFTRRAAKEIKMRLQTGGCPVANDVVAGTFHFFCLMMMRRMGGAFGLEDISVIDRDDQLQLMKLARGKYKEKKEEFTKPAELVNLYSFARNTEQKYQEFLNDSGIAENIRPRVNKVLEEYESRKRDNKYFDYDDILYYFADSLRDNKKFASFVKRQYDHILVDEMQDTNPLQWRIIEGLRDPAKLFCVGDDAQSIYAFRGADFKNVHSFSERIPNSDILKLEENYRSTQEILDVSNWLLEQSPLNYNKYLTAFRGSGIKPVVYDFGSEYDEAEWIADDLSQRFYNGSAWQDHMVLARTGYSLRVLEGKLVERDVPYRLIGGTSLLQASHVKDLFALIRAALSFNDELAWARYLMLWPRIGTVGASRVISGFAGKSDDEIEAYLNDKYSGRPEIMTGIHIVRRFIDTPDKVIYEAGAFLEEILRVSYDKWETRKKDFKLLEELAENHRSIKAFLEVYTLDPITSSEALLQKNEDVVTLITVHSAKGTEAPTCYVIRAEEGMYPSRRAKTDDEIEEERRVLYVAMTRAQNELILTRTASAMSGFWNNFEGEYFLENIPHTLLEVREGDLF